MVPEAPGAQRPRLALAMGDAAGISAELAAKVLADPAVRTAASTTVIGDRRVLEEGARMAARMVAQAITTGGA